jgi:hypothetical protein
MAEVWSKDPPPVAPRVGRPGKYDWTGIVEELKARPGEWLLIDDEAARGLPSAILRRKMTALQDPEWNFMVTTRNNNRETGTAEVWMSAEPAVREEN